MEMDLNKKSFQERQKAVKEFDKKHKQREKTKTRNKQTVFQATVAFSLGIKRFFDIVFSLVFFVLFSPIFSITAIAIIIENPGPIIFSQKRVGKGGKLFDFYKFRSMVVGADKMKDKLLDHNETDGVIFKMKRDPRVTNVGRFIRRFSIDELPQLLNVLIGDMSLVGPRPPLPREVAEYTLEDRKRLDITPGITCIWQVSGRSDIPFDKQVHLDKEYIHSKGFWQDSIILLHTVGAVLSGKGAY